MANKKKAPRVVAFVPADADRDERGRFRVSLVVEGENGHRPTGTWPYHGKIGETLPWFWGPTLADAEKAAEQYNEDRGIPREEAFGIVARSMFSRRHRGSNARVGRPS